SIKGMPVDRFVVVDRSMTRLIDDVTVLAAVSALAQVPLSTVKIELVKLLEEITDETRPEFIDRQVLLTCDIAKDTTLIGNPASMKIMITNIILAVLHMCQRAETISITGLRGKKSVSMSFVSHKDSIGAEFKPWPLGKLRMVPTNGIGITLAAVQAMAQLQRGYLSVRQSANQRQEYQLSFEV
ncbi:MAG: hypothetical protein K2Z81_05400, partial [Cyanobacteria bacterium]|nr:hypothetical protein [Cyanobacteriota bacterium]